MAAHINTVGNAVADLSRRVDAVAVASKQLPPPMQTHVPAPAAPAPVFDESQLYDKLSAKIATDSARARESVSSEVRAATARERASLETVLSHKVEQLATKLVRERVAQAMDDLKQELAVERPEPAVVAAPRDDLEMTLAGLGSADAHNTNSVVSVVTPAPKRASKAKKAVAVA